MGVSLKSSQYTVQRWELSIEDIPVWTENWYARGFPTVRVYRTYKVEIVDGILCQNLVYASRQVSDDMLGNTLLGMGGDAQNSVLALPCIGCERPFLRFPSKGDSTKSKRIITC